MNYHSSPPLAKTIKRRVSQAARVLGASDPLEYVGDLLDRSFALPLGDEHYANNHLTPGTAAFEPSFSEREPHALRFTLEPLGPEENPLVRRAEATREMRRLVNHVFGRNALHWFDGTSEEWRGLFSHPRLQFGAWLGTSYDGRGLQASKVYYELGPGQLNVLPRELGEVIRIALESLPSLVPVFTTITCKRDEGKQRVTFFMPDALRIADLQPLLERLGLAHQLSSLMQIVGLTLGGRFEMPPGSTLLGFAGTMDEPEVKLEVLLGMIPDLPPAFPELLSLGLAERPQQLRAMQTWYQAFTPDSVDWPGNLSVMSVHITRRMPARVNVYLRPIELELNRPVEAVA
jgi:hypothetical protein